MKQKPTVFIIVDTETSKWDGLVFDIAWKAIDRRGNIYDHQAFIATDVLAYDQPYYWEKISYYLELASKQKVKPTKFKVAQFKFNKTIRDLSNKGHRVIICAYNASFDIKALNTSCEQLVGNEFFQENSEYLDIWHAWCLNCPTNYRKIPTGSAKGFKTSAEVVYRFEAKDEGFIEDHIAISDIECEHLILDKILRRKKKLPIVTNPKNFIGSPWRLAAKRVK